jgi:hypothetical protein
MAQDIKVSASTDTASFRTADNAIKQLISSVERLNKSMENVARSINKIQTGSQNQGSISNIKSPSQGKQGGIVAAVLGTGDNGSVGRLVSEADRAFESVSRKVRSFTDRAMSDISRLSTSIAHLKPAYSDSGWESRAQSSIGGSRQQAAAQFAIDRGIPQIMPSMPGVPSIGGEAGGGGGKGSVTRQNANQAAFLNNITSGVEALSSGNVGGFLSSTLGRAGLVGAAGYAGYRIADAVTGVAGNVYNANQQFAVENPVALQQKLATAVSPFRNMAMAGINKDYASISAWQNVFKNPEVMKSIADVKLNKESINRLMNDRSILGQTKELLSSAQTKFATSDILGMVQSATSTLSPSTAWVMESLKGYVGKHNMLDVSDWIANEKRSIPDYMLKSIRERERQAKQEQLMADSGDRLNAAHNAEMGKMDVFTQIMSNEIGQNYLGRFQTLAAGGRTSGIIRRKGQPDMTAYEYYNAKAMSGGWSLGDDNANYQQLLGIGKGYGSIAGGHTLISAGLAGFGNLGQIMRTAGTVGGTVGAAKDFSLGLAQHTIGNNALDVSVGRDLYGGVSQAALATGMYGASNLNWVGSNLAAMTFGGGLDVAGQQKSLYGYEMGNRLNQTYTSGTRSNFDRALANRAAIGAAGSFGGASRDLMRLTHDPRLLASIAGGADRPEWLDSSITKEMASDFQRRLRVGKFADVVDSTWKSDPITYKLLEEVRANKNDSNLVIGQHLENAGAKKASPKWFKQLHFLTTKLGRAIGGDNPQADISMLEEEYLSTIGLPPPKGSGAWRPGMSGLEKVAAEKGAQVEEAKGIAGASGQVKGSLDVSPAEFAKRSMGSMVSMTGLINSFDAGVENFNKAVDKLLAGLGMGGYKSSPVHAKGPKGN